MSDNAENQELPEVIETPVETPAVDRSETISPSVDAPNERIDETRQSSPTADAEWTPAQALLVEPTEVEASPPSTLETQLPSEANADSDEATIRVVDADGLANRDLQAIVDHHEAMGGTPRQTENFEWELDADRGVARPTFANPDARTYGPAAPENATVIEISPDADPPRSLHSEEVGLEQDDSPSLSDCPPAAAGDLAVEEQVHAFESDVMRSPEVEDEAEGERDRDSRGVDTSSLEASSSTDSSAVEELATAATENEVRAGFQLRTEDSSYVLTTDDANASELDGLTCDDEMNRDRSNVGDGLGLVVGVEGKAGVDCETIEVSHWAESGRDGCDQDQQASQQEAVDRFYATGQLPEGTHAITDDPDRDVTRKTRLENCQLELVATVEIAETPLSHAFDKTERSSGDRNWSKQGDFGELAMDQAMNQLGFSLVGYGEGSGLDGLYRNGEGDFAVVEAKFGSSGLSVDQMSDDWVSDGRIEDAVGSETAEQVRAQGWERFLVTTDYDSTTARVYHLHDLGR